MVRPSGLRLSISISLALALGACGNDPEAVQEPAAAVTAPQDEGPPPFELSSTARLAPLGLQTNIYERPERTAKRVGYVRLGTSIPRSDKPVPGAADCVGDWYGVPHGGYVCVGTSIPDPQSPVKPNAEATLDLEHKLIKALGFPPDVTKPMPYRYGFLRANSALYLQIPNKRDQEKFEFAVRGHRKAYEMHKEKWNSAEHGGPNAVPLDENGLAQTPPEAPYPSPPRLVTEDELFGHAIPDEIPWWLQPNPRSTKRDRYDRALPNISSFVVGEYGVMGGRIYRHAGVAVIGSFDAGARGDDRRFLLTLDGRLLPEDKVKPHFASAFHGVVVDGKDVRLPFAFVKSPRAHLYTPDELKARWPKAGDLAFRQTINLTGKMRRFPTHRYIETADGDWVNVKEVAFVDRPTEWPKAFDYKKERWIDISIWQQTLVAYDGDRPVYATMVSTGIDGMDDPKKTRSTIRGEFRIDAKHVTATMDAEDKEGRFELRDVPWVQFFEQGYALHAAYWHDDYGKTRSHGCVNMSPIDARWLFNWTEPRLPPSWHGVYSRPGTGQGTWVRVRG